MKRTLLLLSIAALALLPAALLRAQAQTSTRTSLEAKLALENSLEKRVRMVLAEALGTEDIIVIISAELQEQDKKAKEILPGIPRQETMGEPSLSSSLTMVKKITASLILDRAVSEADTQLARKLAGGLLGLPADRQDLITVEKMDFRKAKPLTLADLFLPPNLWSLVWVVVVAVLSVFTVMAFLSPLSKSARAFVEAFNAHTAAVTASSGERAERRDETERAKETAGAAKETQAAQASDGRKPPFWFLTSGHVPSLAFIMKQRSTEDLTILLSYAPAEAATKLAELLYPKSAEALAQLPKVTLLPEARVRALEAEVQSALDYVVGGEEKALNILSSLDEAVQEKALSAFSRLDPLMGRKLVPSVVRLANIQDLEPGHAQALARRLPARVLAAALKNSPYAAAFMAKLAGGMQDRLKQELDLTRDLPAEAYKGDRARLVETMRQMLKEGLIALKPGGAPRPAGAAAPGAARPTAARPAAAPLPGAKPPAAPLKK